MLREELFNKLKYCKLSGMIDVFDRVLEEALDKELNHLEFFEMLLDEKVINRENRRYNRLLKNACFPTIKTIDTFDFSKAPFLNKKEIMELFTLDFLNDNQNIIFIGDQGTGKTHIVTSIGVETCKQGKSVLFFTAASLGNKLIEMQEQLALGKFIEKLRKVDLLIIDELGYVSLSHRSTQLLFQVFSERYEKGSIMIISNLEFGEWGNIFNDEIMAAAIIDRLIHNSIIKSFKGSSYRLLSRQEKIV
ncbi:DNA replication protein DnaC [Keratinibaculum paraultunense]|uniref:DNA replication protein DnaC n=1 Tax=Keratinibaculum paraultunense TaxID=1278232 RepID=A0A4R3KML1_9FIRM|nr:IS21-like element helper ATPase IstB [Keratinibaculum paraultunense]QQY79062.1 IS21-like element helper ATPase IstB [Keratinibaculum paraultunense]TCS85592.1 DNA replication protein DnaC [Keratinibaculum paraultunense]